MKKRLLFLFASMLVLCMVFTLVFAGSEEKAGKKAKKGEVIELKHFTWRPEDVEKWQKIYDVFEQEYPNIKMINDPIPADRYFRNLEVNLEGGEADPIVNIWQNRVWNIEMYERGYFLQLNDLLPEFNDVPAFYQYNYITDDGRYFACPFSAQYTGMLYNKKIFREHNIEIPETWDEFIAMCEKLKKAGVVPLMFQTMDAWHIHYSFDLMNKPFLGGHDFIDELTSGRYDFTNRKFVQALKRLYSLKPYFPENYTGLGYGDMQNMLSTDQVAIWPGCGSWEVYTLKDLNPDLELGAFPTPVAKKGDPAYVTVFVDGGLCITNNVTDEEKEASLVFLKWMCTPEAGLLVNEHIGFFNAWGNDKFDDPAMKDYAAMAGPNGEYVISDWAILLSDGTPTATDLIQVGIQALMADVKTAEEVAQDIKTGLSVWYGK